MRLKMGRVTGVEIGVDVMVIGGIGWEMRSSHVGWFAIEMCKMNDGLRGGIEQGVSGRNRRKRSGVVVLYRLARRVMMGQGGGRGRGRGRPLSESWGVVRV